jgi:ATP-binding cassette subfamily B protein
MSDYRQLARLWPFVRPYRRWLAVAVLALGCASASVLALPQAVAGFIEAATVPAGGTSGMAELGLMFALALGYAGAMAVRLYATGRVAEGTGGDLRARGHAHLIGLPPPVFEKRPLGDLLSRLTTDVAVVQGAVGGLVLVTLRGTIQFAGAIAVMAVTEPVLTAIALAAAPLVLAAIAGLGATVRRLACRTQDLQGETVSAIEETLTGIQTVQAFGREDDERRRVGNLVHATIGAARRRDIGRAWMMFAAISVIFAAVLVVMWIGAREVRLGAMGGGDLLQFVLYSILAANAAAALSDIHAEAAQAMAAARRVLSILDEAAPATRVPSRRPIPEGRGRLVFENVSFAYPGRPDHLVLDDFCLDVEAGEKVAVVGASGSGKTTLFKLLLRFHEPCRGRVLIDGIDIRSVDGREIRRLLAWVPQEPALFSGTVLENLRYGRPEATRDEAIEAAAAARLHDFLRELPQGYDTPLGVKGAQLSGGQRQRLAIARALLCEARIILLDEATSFLDAENEYAFHRDLVASAAGRTVLMATHRLSTARVADRTVVMDGGRIVGTGAHAQLVAQCPQYERLFAATVESGRPFHDLN